MATIQPMELLAPAGDREALLAGIAAGADAVYLGGKAFSARQSAANFDLPMLEEAANLLHLHGKKLYVTVNTLIADTEMPAALRYLADLYNLGVDAVIVQDLGLIHLARQYLPELKLHASTQMTIHNREGAIWLKTRGIDRVVLARELTLEEIAAIVRDSGLEVEVFVHGALCVCYSGQCLMSSMIGGRSGNRGRCAQPCRMEYHLVRSGRERGHEPIPADGTYLLSPKDLALLPLLPGLDRAGVRSLKIEGRMKRPEYVFTVTSIYRQALDRYYHHPQDFQVDPGEWQELEQAFNRGFSTGYAGGNRNHELMSFTRPNNRGVYLGRVAFFDKLQRRLRLKLEADLEIGDEVEAWVSQGGRAVSPVRELFRDGRKIDQAPRGSVVELTIDHKVFPGDRIFKVFSIQNDRRLKQGLAPDSVALKIPCNAEVNGNAGGALRITLRDATGNRGTALSDTPLQPAKNRPLTRDVLEEQLGRLGNTPFRLGGLEISLPENVMLPIGELNQLRRKAIQELTAKKLDIYRRPRVKLPDSLSLTAGPVKFDGSQAEKSSGSVPVQSEGRLLSVWVGDLEGVAAAAGEGAALIYAGGDELTGFHWDEKSFREAIDIAHLSRAELVVGLPRINREGQRGIWEQCLELALGLPADGIMISDLGTLQRVQEYGTGPLYLNYPLNCFNSAALAELAGPRIAQITISPELTLEQISGLKTGIRLECLVQGPLELMVSEYCPLHTVLGKTGACPGLCSNRGQFALRDRLNLDFPIYPDQYCRMHLLNSVDLCLYADLDHAAFSGLVWRLELKTLPAQKVAAIVRLYRQVANDPGIAARHGDIVLDQLKELTGRGITKGHYFRGVE